MEIRISEAYYYVEGSTENEPMSWRELFGEFGSGLVFRFSILPFRIVILKSR